MLTPVSDIVAGDYGISSAPVTCGLSCHCTVRLILPRDEWRDVPVPRWRFRQQFRTHLTSVSRPPEKPWWTFHQISLSMCSIVTVLPNFPSTANEIWAVTDLPRGDFGPLPSFRGLQPGTLTAARKRIYQGLPSFRLRLHLRLGQDLKRTLGCCRPSHLRLTC